MIPDKAAKWRHGWIPLNAAALAEKDRHEPLIGSGMDKLNEDDRSFIHHQLGFLPEADKAVLRKHGVKINVHEEVSGSLAHNGAVYNPAENAVELSAVKNKHAWREHSQSAVIVHELGHAMDRVKGRLSQDSLYKKIVQTQSGKDERTGKRAYLNMHGNKYEEVFAEAYAAHHVGYKPEMFDMGPQMREIAEGIAAAPIGRDADLANSAKWSHGWIPLNEEAFKEKHPDVELRLSHNKYTGHTGISLIRTSEADRGSGKASAALDDLVKSADALGKVLTLTPDPIKDRGAMSKTALAKWYKSRGFVRNRDPMISDSMVRYPVRKVSLANPSPVLPYYGGGDPQATVTIQSPPSQDETVQHVVEVLLAAYAVDKAAHVLAAIVPGINVDIWRAVLVHTGGMTGHTAHPVIDRFERGTPGEEVARSGARREVFYRAAYLLNAAERVNADVRSGVSIPDAIQSEKPYFAQHEAARTNRLLAAAKVGRAANWHGNLLGWYLDPLLKNEPECIAANGNNFYADQSTIIGDPGAVHPYCGCVAGPPHALGGMVNEAVAAARTVRFEAPRRYGIKRKAS